MKNKLNLASMILAPVILICSLCSCEPAPDIYTGSTEKSAVFTAAVNTVATASSYFDTKIKCIKTDGYGRALYYFDDRHYPTVNGLEKGYLHIEVSLIVIQNYTKESVYYYEDECCLNLHGEIDEKWLSSDNQLDTFKDQHTEDEAMNEFLEANDWGDPEIHTDKCLKKKIVQTKISKESEKTFRQFPLQETFHSLYPDLEYTDIPSLI